jgi:hypothetical protein
MVSNLSPHTGWDSEARKNAIFPLKTTGGTEEAVCICGLSRVDPAGQALAMAPHHMTTRLGLTRLMPAYVVLTKQHLIRALAGDKVLAEAP